MGGFQRWAGLEPRRKIVAWMRRGCSSRFKSAHFPHNLNQITDLRSIGCHISCRIGMWQPKRRPRRNAGVASILAARGVNLIASGAGEDLSNIPGADAASRENLDSAARSGQQFGNQRSPLEGGAGAAAGHHSPDAELGDLVQRGNRIGHEIKSPVKDDYTLASPARIHLSEQLLASGHVHGSVGAKHAESDPISAGLQCRVNVPAHDLEFRLAITEPSRPRADHDNGRQRYRPSNFPQ